MSQPLRYTPDQDHRFFCYSPEGDGLTFWATAHERDAYAADEIRTYLDEDKWAEEVEGLFAAEVTHITKAIGIQKPQGELDEDGYDENGDGPWPSPHWTRCDYALLPLPAAPGVGGMSDIKQTVYHHGGSRIYREHDGRRDLIADTYTDEHFAEALYAFVLDYFKHHESENPCFLSRS